jgi:hypothetical protein
VASKPARFAGRPGEGLVSFQLAPTTLRSVENSAELGVIADSVKMTIDCRDHLATLCCYRLYSGLPFLPQQGETSHVVKFILSDLK